MEIRKDCPVRLSGCRVWRTYLGGSCLNRYLGNPEGTDGHFPEEWIASVVTARNVGREMMTEGLNMTVDYPELSLKKLIESNPEGYLGKSHAERLGNSLGVLVKLIDSAERLTVQVHPDAEKAKELFHSEYGKTECWHILGGREINGEKPCVYMGFRQGVTREYWKECFVHQDISAMLDCLHRFEVQPGDTILIQGGVPHAIGAGCFLLEIQEPTDYTIRVERTTPSGGQVADEMCHQGLGFEKMFECFHYDTFSEEEAKKHWFLPEKVLKEEGGNKESLLVDYQDTPCFCMKLLEIQNSMCIKQERCGVMYILEGCGSIESNGNRQLVGQGMQFFLPDGIREMRLTAKDGSRLKVIQCFGRKLT